MVEEMKFEDSLLTGYLVKNLEPLTEADPVILSKYVVALLKKDKPLKELQKLCTDNLVEFLGNGAKSFTAELFQSLEDGSFVKAERTLDAVQGSEPSVTEGIHHLKNSSTKKENLSTSSEHSTDPEDKEVSDDDDDDRNHKHRRREARQSSFENDPQEQFIRRPSRKRNKPYVNGQNFLNNDTQSSDNQKEYNPSSERNIFPKFDKHRSDLAPLLRPPVDLCQRTRFGQSLRNDLGVRFDLSTSVGRPSLGRGRGRNAIPWSQHDSRFNHDTFDFASQMASQGSTHPGLFVGTGLPSAVSSQSSSWGGFGFIPAMTNRIMDPLNPLGLPGALRPTINPPLNLGMPRQRCRDFEERGFCLRGDMCPMEHGLNRIVVEDVQSLSQFNLPVSIPSSHGLGIQAGSGSLPPVPPPSGQLANNNIAGRNSKSGVVDEEAKLSDVAVSSRGGDADVYDPDQPLWNNDPSDTSAARLRLPTPNHDEEPSWDGDSSARQSFRSDGIESEFPSRRITGNIGPQNINSSVWGRVGSRNKLDPGNRVLQGNVAGNIRNDMKEDLEEAINSSQGKVTASVEIGSKAMTVQPFPRLHTDAGHKSGRVFPKALRTLYVNGVPQQSNRREALISHFQKFGEIVDIYIPLNSEKAFIQFSKREEAEASLKSPDAVMGNRFIKLSWANRDRIPDYGQNSGQSKSVPPTVVITSVPSQQPVANGGKEPVRISTQTTSNTNSDPPTPSAGPIKGQTINALKAAPPMQKKLENLELLEELRRKQESLAKKRDDFKRQLDKFEKQAISSKKGDAASEQAVKRRKVNSSSEAEKAAITKSSGLSTSETDQVADKTLEKINSYEVLTSDSPKVNSTILQQSSRKINQISPVPASSPSRFKLDNRSTSFRILPPLPADLVNVAVLKDHFSRYGVVLSVILEEPEIHTEDDGLKQSEKCSACITFSTRHSAERAYQTGKFWEGHNLQFKWLTVHLHSNSDCSTRESYSDLSPKVVQDVNQSNPAASRSSSSSSAENPLLSVISEVLAVGNTDHNQDIEGKNCASISLSTSPVENTGSSPTMPSNEKCSTE